MRKIFKRCQTGTNRRGIQDRQIESDKLFEPRYNIAPTQMIPVVLEQSGERIIEALRWGLIPSWAKDESIGSKMINARAETLAEKPSFRDAFQKHIAASFRLPAFTNGRNKPKARNNRFIFV